MNGFYQGYDIPAGCLCQMCVGELCWRRAKNEAGNEVFVIDTQSQAMKIVECGGGLLE